MSDPSDNYQLKWNSFSSHLYSSVASSINNATFADVSLYTIDGQQILAHRFVLSACSQYLHTILKIQAKITTNLPLVIVLPPEINYKTMKTLLQYMYSGETTVSKEILESVLRGGDLLKVRGLWRPTDDQCDDEKLVKLQEQRSPPENGTQHSQIGTKEKITTSKEDQNESQGNGTLSNDSSSQYLVIKEEPIEWNDLEGEMIDCADDVFDSEMTIKPETIMSDSEDKQEDMYSPLTCELCAEVFSQPGDWVRHIQSHTDMLPAKRQRRGRTEDDSDDGSFPPLHCDMCQKYFDTPAEWVRHIENSHTEIELRVSNKTGSVKPVRVNKHINSSHKVCGVCSKKFPSHASMLIHKRTHTGEKPFMCDHCQKGFNVKSNLLRHLRTLHDKIINSSDVEYKEENIDVLS